MFFLSLPSMENKRFSGNHLVIQHHLSITSDFGHNKNSMTLPSFENFATSCSLAFGVAPPDIGAGDQLFEWWIPQDGAPKDLGRL